MCIKSKQQDLFHNTVKKVATVDRSPIQECFYSNLHFAVLVLFLRESFSTN